jgi:hypothetical protein
VLTPPGIRGIYLGFAEEDAWFIYLEPTSAASAMYRPFKSLALCDVKTGAGGAITFRSAALSGTEYQFTGRLSHDTLVGTVTSVRTRSGTIVTTRSIVLRRVTARFLTGSPDPFSGDYDQLESSEQTGDMVGREVVLLDLVDRVVGFAQDYQGGPDLVWEITGDRVRDTLRLTWRSPERVEVDTAVVRGDTLVGYHGHLRAVRHFSIPELFRAPNRLECE